MFTGGPELILKVTEAHVERIFEIIIHCDNATVQAQFMVTLEAMAKVCFFSLFYKSSYEFGPFMIRLKKLIFLLDVIKPIL